jgi:acetyl esterase/lipase
MIKVLIATLGVSVMIADVNADQPVVPLWPQGRIPLLKESAPEKINESRDDIIRLTNISNPSLTLYTLPGAEQPAPAMLICPGGGYSILAWNHEGTEVAEFLNGRGIAAFVLKYRVPGNQRDAAFCDAQRALRVIRARAREFNINPERVGIMGFSAGGHLAVRVSHNFGISLYEPVDAADQLSARPDFAAPVYPAYLNTEGTLTMAEGFSIAERGPPTFIAVAQDDRRFVDGSIAYYLALKAAGVPVEMHLYPSGGHGFGMRKRGGTVDTWPERLAEWLRAHALQ